MKRTILLIAFLLTAHCSLLTAFGQGTPGTVRCPSQTDTLDSLFRIKDAPRSVLSVLSGTLTSNATTIVVTTTASFPSSGSIKIDDEVIYYSSKTDTAFNSLVRGASGTAAASHANSALVTGPILAAHHNTLAQAIICAEQLSINAVPNTRTVNGHALSANVVVTPGDLGLVVGADVEAYDADLLAIAGLTPANDDLLQRKAGAWINRTPAQFKSDLVLVKNDVGLNLVPNVDATNPANITQDSTHRFATDAEKSTWNGKQDALGFTAVPNTRTVNGHALSSNVVVTPGDLSLVVGADVEAYDADLLAIAGLTPANDDLIQRKAGAWINRTPAQFKSDLVLVWADINKTTSSLADLTTRNAGDLSSGTLPDARFPATLPALSGANLTNLNASNLASGTVPAPRLPNPSATTIGGIESLAAVSHKWINTISTLGVPSATQPDASDISGLGTAATQNTGTSGANLPFLNGTNTWSGTQTFGGGVLNATSPVFTAPSLGVASATSLNGNTFTTGTYTLTGTAAKTLNFTNTLTLGGTDSTTMTFPSTSATIARIDAANSFTGLQTLVGAANTGLIASTNGSNTGSNATSAVDLAWTLNTSGSPDVFALRVTDTARGANTKLFNIYGGASGTTSMFNVDRVGNVNIGNGNAYFDSNVRLYLTTQFGWANGAPPAAAIDTILTRFGPANLQLGAAGVDLSANVVPQKFSVQNVLVGGTADQAGRLWTFSDSVGKGTGQSGGFEFDVHPAGSTGTALNAASSALTIDSTRLVTIPGTLAVTGTVNTATGYQVNGAAALANVLRGNGTNFVSAQLAEADLGFTDITTNNASTSKHGFLKKLSGSSSDYLGGDGNWNVLPSGVAGGNPTASVGLSAVNGSAVTFIRSDAAPALDQSIAPTWTGLHTFKYSDAGTNTFTDVVTLGHNSSGTPAASFGGSLLFNLKSSTTNDRNAARIGALWTTATDASRTSAFDVQLVNNAGALAGVARFFGSGGFSVNSTTDPGAGIINANTGYRIGNAAPSGHFPRGNGANYVDGTIQSSDVASPSWVAATLLNSWANYGNGFANASYALHLGFVCLRGMIKDGSSTAFVLPGGSWPSASLALPTISNAAAAYIKIDVSGNVIPTAGNTAWYSLDGLCFVPN